MIRLHHCLRSGAWPILLTLILAASPLVAQPGGQELEGKTVTSIEFAGLRDLEPSAVRLLMATRVGEPFSRERLDQDIKSLVGKDVFSIIPSVRAEPDASGEGVAVTVLGDENVRAVGVIFIGAVEFDREELMPHVRTRAGAQVDDFTLDVDRQELIRFYQGKGYHYADVEFLKQRERYGDLVIFKITEGSEVKIRDVVFTGNASFSSGELLKQMPFTDTPGIFSSTPFIERQVKSDAVQLTNFYFGHGFLNARVTLLPFTPTPDHGKVDLQFVIEEGEPFIVRSITIEGMTLFDPDTVILEMLTKIGGHYEVGFDLRRDVVHILDMYQQRGYTDAEVDDHSVIGLEENVVDVILTLAEGELIRVGEIIITGNMETQDRILRREIEIYTGEPLNLRKLERGEQRLKNLQYFNIDGGVRIQRGEMAVQSWQIYQDTYISLRDTPRRTVKDILVSVEEIDTGSIRFAAGVGSSTGLVGDITYTKLNFDPLDWPDGFSDIFDAFTGAGQFLTLSFQPGTRVSRWRAAWGNPRLWDTYWSLAGEVFQVAWIREAWDEDRLGYNVAVGHPLGDDIQATISLTDQLVNTKDVYPTAPQLVFDFEGKFREVTLGLQLSMARVDDFNRPTNGWVAAVEFTHGGLWGDITYNKIHASGTRYIRLFEDEIDRPHVFIISGTAGWAAPAGNTTKLPVYDRFYIGGAGSLRGFKYRGIGPRDNNYPIGGKAVWTLSGEYEFPLLGEQLRGVAFVDTGSVAESWSSSGIGEFRVGAGVGIRLVIPFLGPTPVAIDFGIPVLRRTGDQSQLISFSFGSRF